MLGKRGSAEIVAFILILPFLILPVANTVNILADLTVYDTIRQACRKALLRMEMEGGMTQEGLYELEHFLQSRGLDFSRTHVDYTPYPVDYGDEVVIRMSYIYRTRRYTIGLGGISRVEEDAEMVYGPVSSVSKKYER